jgi:hypothetical protein
MNSPLSPVLSRRLPRVAVVLLSVMVGLMWLAASNHAPPIAPFEPTDQPIQRNLSQALDRPAAPSSAAGRTSADYWSEVGKALGAF